MAKSARSETRQVNPLQALALLVTFVLLAGVGGLLAAGLILPVAAGTSAMTDGTIKAFEDLPDELEPGPLSEQSILLDNKGKKIAAFYAENRVIMPLDEISIHMQNATVAIEDRRFFGHGGVDLEGMARAFIMNTVSDTDQGASTLTQQYVKNVLIEKAVRDGDRLALEEAREKTYDRKLREAKLAVSIEKKMSKFEILEGYLNIAQFGASVYGVESASRYYFNKSAADLSIVEAATIAGITKAPNTYDPTGGENNVKVATTRRNTVLDTMYQQGFITKAEHAEARKTKLEDSLDVNPAKNSCEGAGGNAFFCDYVTKVILDDPVFGDTQEDREELLMRGGLVIHTTLDRKLQKIANKELRDTVPVDDPTGIADALVSVIPDTGEIRVMAQNRRYVANGDKAKVGETTVNYSADQAHGGSKGFQAGSTFKPFVLAEWLRSGHSLETTVNANRQEWGATSWKAPCTSGIFDSWNPQNASDGLGSGQQTVLKATANSINTAYASMANQLDLCKIADTADLVGFRPSATNQEGEITVTPSMILGIQDTSPLSMASAFATFANGGKYCPPVAITKITGSDGKELELPDGSCRKVLDGPVASGVTYAMEGVLTNGGASQAQLANDRPAAGKTGSTQENKHTWFVGYTPELSTAVWIGHPDRGLPMQRIVINGQYHRSVYGSTLAAPTWKQFMDKALDGQPVTKFAKVNQKVLEGEKVTVPQVSGQSVSSVEKTLKDAGLQPVVRSGRVFSNSPAGTVAYVHPTGKALKGSQVTIYISSGTTQPASPPKDEGKDQKKDKKDKKDDKKSKDSDKKKDD